MKIIWYLIFDGQAYAHTKALDFGAIAPRGQLYGDASTVHHPILYAFTVMNMSVNCMQSDIVLSALRIYLTHLLQQTQDIAQSCKFQQTISPTRTAFEGKTLWKLAIEAADEASDSIKDCQLNLSLDVGSVCVVETLQDALREALYRALKNDSNDQHSHGILSLAYASRAKYLINGFTERNSNNVELSNLWFLAAQNICQRLELNYALAGAGALFNKSVSYHKTADTIEMERTSSPYHDRAVGHYRYAAALSALGRPHSHDYAAELYLEASSASSEVKQMKDPAFSKYYKIEDTSGAGKLALLERVAASWLLAAEMVAAKATGSEKLRADPTIQSVVAAAKKYAANKEKVASIVNTMEKHREAVAATKDALAKCRDARMLPLWEDLVSKLQEATIRAETCYQRFINGDLDANEATKQISEALKTEGASAYTLSELQLCQTKIIYYKQRAVQALQGARPSPLESKCWAQAAKYIEDVVQMQRANIDAGSPRGRDDKQNSLRIFRGHLADDCVYIVQNVLEKSVEYLNKARGAEAGVKDGKDPREAQMWRQAAECQVQKAELKWKELFVRERNFDPSRLFISSRQDSKAVKAVEERMKHNVAAAEYLHLAFKHRKLPNAETRQNGTRVTVLYERAALVMVVRDDITNSQTLANKLINQHVAFINLLNGAEEVPWKDIVVRELISDYGASAFSASDPVKQELWAKANDLLNRSVVHGLSLRKAQTGGACAKLYACAAQADMGEKRLCFESAARVCEECFCVGENPPKEVPSDDDSLAESSDEEEDEVEYPFKLSLYHSVLAETVLTLGGVTSGLPSELTTFFEQAQQQSAEDEGLRSTAAEHATYLVLKNRCVQQCAELPEGDATCDAWKAVQREVDVLLVLLHQRAEDVYEYYQTRLISLKVSFQALVVKCHVVLAVAPPDSPSAEAWKEAVKICQNAAPKGASSAKVYENAVAAAERAVQATQAHS